MNVTLEYKSRMPNRTGGGGVVEIPSMKDVDTIMEAVIQNPGEPKVTVTLSDGKDITIPLISYAWYGNNETDIIDFVGIALIQ